MTKNLVTLIWWPHSGGRWLSRSILKNHTKIFQTTFVHPWIFNSTDDVLSNDKTAQIHKARSLKELEQNLKVLKNSTDRGRIFGLNDYYNSIIEEYDIPMEKDLVLGESCMGSPNPSPVDLKSVFSAFPEMKIIHLVRNPVDSFVSFRNRYEMDADPIKIGNSWSALNSQARLFFENEGKEYASQCLVVRYEDLLNDLKNEVQKICHFLEIEFEDQMLSETGEKWGKGSKLEKKESFEDLIKMVAENEMKKYGYL